MSKLKKVLLLILFFVAVVVGVACETRIDEFEQVNMDCSCEQSASACICLQKGSGIIKMVEPEYKLPEPEKVEEVEDEGDDDLEHDSHRELDAE